MKRIERISDEAALENAIRKVKDAGYIIVKDLKDIKRLAIDAGYRVSDRIELKMDVDSIGKLVDYFYTKLDKKKSQSYKMQNSIRDFRIAKQFVMSRMNGASKQAALQECVEIINTIFNDIDNVYAPLEIRDIGILGAKKMRWVIERAVSIINNRRKEERRLYFQYRSEMVENSLDTDHEAVGRKLDNMLDGLSKKKQSNVGEAV